MVNTTLSRKGMEGVCVCVKKGGCEIVGRRNSLKKVKEGKVIIQIR